MSKDCDPTPLMPPAPKLSATFSATERRAFEMGMTFSVYISTITEKLNDIVESKGEREFHVLVQKVFVGDLVETLKGVHPMAVVTWEAAPKSANFQEADDYYVLHISVSR